MDSTRAGNFLNEREKKMPATKKRRYSLGSTQTAREERGTYKSTSIMLPEGMDFFKVEKPGAKYLCFVPYVVKEETPGARPGDLFPFKRFWVHRGVGPNKGSYCCPLKNWNKRCPICEGEELAGIHKVELNDGAPPAPKLKKKKRKLKRRSTKPKILRRRVSQ